MMSELATSSIKTDELLHLPLGRAPSTVTREQWNAEATAMYGINASSTPN
jgi:hypothetical protein